MDSIVKQLKQFKADAIYEKKKHYNAAERKRRYYRILSFIQIFLNAITGTTLLTVVFGKGSKMAEINCPNIDYNSNYIGEYTKNMRL